MSYISIVDEKNQKTAERGYFAGINRTDNTNAGEWEDMQNISGTEYPFLSVSKKQIPDAEYNKIFINQNTSSPQNIRAVVATRADCEKKGFCGIAGQSFYYNGHEKPMKKPAVYDDDNNFLYGMEIASDGKIQLLWANRIIIIHGYDCEKRKPYVYYYDTDDEGETEDVVKSYEYSDNDDYSEKTLKIKSDATASVKFTYRAGVGFTGGFWNFKTGDEVFIDGVMTYADSRWNRYDDGEITSASVVSYSETMTGTVGNDSLWDIELNLKIANQKGESPYGSAANKKFFHIYKKIPYMTHLALHKGRLWGANPNGEYVYASALGELFDFNSFEGLNSDSIFLESASQGGYWGVLSCGDALVTFKEDEMEAIYGDLPNETAVGKSYSGYGTLDINSCTVIDKKLYFLSGRGFLCWSGYLPENISKKLNGKYTSAYAASDNILYRVSAKIGEKTENLVFDTRNNCWYKEGEKAVSGHFFSHNQLYILSDDKVMTFSENCDGVCWFCESIKYFYDEFSLKRINEIWVKARMENGATLEVLTSTQGEEYQKQCCFYAENSGYKTLRIPVRINEGEFWQCKLQGKSACRLMGIKFVYDTGGAVYSNERNEVR